MEQLEKLAVNMASNAQQIKTLDRKDKAGGSVAPGVGKRGESDKGGGGGWHGGCGGRGGRRGRGGG